MWYTKCLSNNSVNSDWTIGKIWWIIFLRPNSFHHSIKTGCSSAFSHVCSKYWPLFLLFFYILCPIPYCISRRVVDDTDSASNACKELAIFLTTGIVISAFGLPIVFARAQVVSESAEGGASAGFRPVCTPLCIKCTVSMCCINASLVAADRPPCVRRDREYRFNRQESRKK